VVGGGGGGGGGGDGDDDYDDGHDKYFIHIKLPCMPNCHMNSTNFSPAIALTVCFRLQRAVTLPCITVVTKKLATLHGELHQ
jgi:hypothetical protein